MGTDATVDLHATRESAMRVAQSLLSKGQRSDAIEILTAWASAANDQEGHKLLAEALRHGPDNPLAKAAFARMEGLKTDTSPLDAARAKWSPETLSKLEKEGKKQVAGIQAEVGYNNNVKHRGQVFHIQTEDSGVKRPHIITHLFADGGRILKSYKRSYAELLEQDNLTMQVRLWMKNQHKEMYIALREGRYDAIIDGKEPGGMEVLEGPPNPELHKKGDSEAKAPTSPSLEAKKPDTTPPAAPKPTSTSVSGQRPAVVAPPAAAPATPAAATPAVAKAPPRAASVSTPAMPAQTPPVQAPPKAESLGPVRAKLHVIRAFGDGPMMHELRSDETSLGRESAVPIVGDRFVARNHAKLIFRGPRLEIDPHPDYPIFMRLRQPAEIELGDTFIAGDQMLRVEANPPPNDGPDRHPTYFYSSPKWATSFRVVQIWEGGIPGLTIVARTNSLQVGRAPTNELCFPSDFWLSDNHCLIEDQGGDHDARFLMLSDLGSKGGTFVRLKTSTPLSTGDEILVGRTRLRVELTSR